MKTAQEEFREIQQTLNSLALKVFDLNLQADTAKLIDLVRHYEMLFREQQEQIQELEKANKILERENRHLRHAVRVRPDLLDNDPDEIPF